MCFEKKNKFFLFKQRKNKNLTNEKQRAVEFIFKQVGRFVGWLTSLTTNKCDAYFCCCCCSSFDQFSPKKKPN